MTDAIVIGREIAADQAGGVTLSLVAVRGDDVRGHILFSPVTIDTAGGTREAVGLAPMAVDPARQRRGIGARLLRAGLALLRQEGHRPWWSSDTRTIIRVSRFAPASRAGLRWEQPCPDAAFLALALAPNGLADRAGVVRSRPDLAAGRWPGAWPAPGGARRRAWRRISSTSAQRRTSPGG